MSASNSDADRRALAATLTDIVRSASRITRAVQADLVAAGRVEKGDRSPVTVADLAVQAVVSHRLAEACPDVPLMGEEDSSVLQGDDRAEVRAHVLARVQAEWPEATEATMFAALDRASFTGGSTGAFFCLDPIDGTAGFLRDMHYAIALALVEDGRVTVGLLGCPRIELDGTEGVLYRAVAGNGTERCAIDGDTWTAVRVSDCDDASRARVCESWEKAHTDQSRSSALSQRLGLAGEPVRIDSQAKYGLVADGSAELYLRIPRPPKTPDTPVRHECLWDHAAGAILIEEAGGTVTDLDGRPLDFGTGLRLSSNRGVVGSNGPLHQRVLDALSD